MTKKENLLHYLKHEPYEEAPKPGEIFLMGNSELICTLDIPVRERPLTTSGYDVFGVHWTAASPASHYTQGQAPVYDDIEEWETQVRFPNIDKFEWDQLRADAAKIDRDQQLINVVMYNGPFERTTMLTSFEDCMVNLITDPENFSNLIGAIADYKIALIHKIWECAQPDIYCIHDDWGTMKSTFMSPDLWRQVIKPHTKRIYDAIHSHGAVVAQHSCGAITPLLDDMVEIGADLWDGQDDCNDMPFLREKYRGRLVLPEKPDFSDMPELPPMGPDAPGAMEMPNEKYGGYDTYPEFLFI